MATQEHINPFAEGHSEEKNRVYEKDKHSHNYKDVEDLADDEPLPGQFEEDKNKETEEPLDENLTGKDFLEFEDKQRDREDEIELLKKEIKYGLSSSKLKLKELQKKPLEEPLGFHESNGVASIGPDIEDGEEFETDHSDSINPILTTEADIKENTAPIREKVSAITAEKNQHLRNRRAYQNRMENLKTMSPQKKERAARSWLGRLLSGELKKTKEEKKYEMIEEMEGYNPDEIPDDPIDFYDENELNEIGKKESNDISAQKHPHYKNHKEFVDHKEYPDDSRNAA